MKAYMVYEEDWSGVQEYDAYLTEEEAERRVEDLEDREFYGECRYFYKEVELTVEEAERWL